MNMHALDLNLIRVFDALMRERSVTRAGDRIGLSQPAVSAALGRLRHAFNDQLFVRQGHEMVPTPLAHDLGERARAALAEVEAMGRIGRALDPATLERTFTLSGADFFSMLLMPLLAQRVRAVAPRVRLRLLDSARGDVPQLLADRAIDLALERPLEPPEWVRRELYFPSPFVIIAAAGNPAVADLREGAPLPLDTFCSLPHVLRSIDGSMSGMVDDALATTGRRREVMLTLPHFQGVALAVAASEALAAVPLQIALSVRDAMGLRLFLPPHPVPAPGVFLYWHGRDDDDPAHRWLRDMVRAAGRELGFSDVEAPWFGLADGPR